MAMASDSSPSFSEGKPAVNPWFIAIAVMLATFMEVLDTSIANVALNHIAGNLSASTDEATWVLTSYLVSNAVVLPATGWLGRFFGRKRFLIVCIGIFTIASALCGLASSLGLLILARIVQGAGGGALQPIAQAVLLESFPREKRGSAMSVYAMGVVVAPILGPTVGGWLTDSYSWRWAFFINIPIGILAVVLCSILLQDPPYLKEVRPGKIDFVGFALLTIWIGCLQIVLDKGQDDDWLSSSFIRWLVFGAALGFSSFLIWELFTHSTGSQSCHRLYFIVLARCNSLRNNFDPAVVPAKPYLLYLFAGRFGDEPTRIWCDFGQYHCRPGAGKPQD
jgi:DHA2 family multidrug resistance protein